MTIVVVGAALLATGCAPRVTVYTHPEADMSFYTKVGIVPFRTLAADRFAGEKFATNFNTALLARGLFDVVDYGIFVNEIQRVAGSVSPAEGLAGGQIKTIGEATGIEGIFVGTISQYDMVATSSGRFPAITVEVRFVDVATGTVVWSATLAETGGPKTPIIGVGEVHTLGELSQNMCRDLVAKLD
jgi:hypothetical protein